MRLAVIGPARGKLAVLARLAQHLLDHARVDRVIYLGDDDAMDALVASWAHTLVGFDAGGSAVFDRAAECCSKGRPGEVNAFVLRERARLELTVYQSLPNPPQRTLELIGGRVAVLVYDKGGLDEEDIAAATLLIFGKSDAPLIKVVGSRTFIAPGPLDSGEGGCALIDDDSGSIAIELLDESGAVRYRTDLGGPQSMGKMRVQGG